jgi:hypothetical protein
MLESPRMARLVLSVLLCVAAPAAAEAKEKPEPVIVIQDRAEMVRGLQRDGVPFESTFVADIEDARKARGDLRRFVREEVKRSDKPRAGRLRKLLQAERALLWHCAGFERGGGRYLHCSLVRGVEALRQPRFPEMSGADAGHCKFGLEAGRIITVTWNGES